MIVVIPGMVTVRLGAGGEAKLPEACATSICHTLLVLEGRKTCMATVLQLVLPMETLGLALHVPLNLHQNSLIRQLVRFC